MDSVILPTDPSTAQDYRIWRKDVTVWQKLSDMPKDKQGLALQYVCQSDTRLHECVLNTDPEKVESDAAIMQKPHLFGNVHRWLLIRGLKDL